MLLPARTAPYEDELFSSWVSRLAVQNGIEPRALVDALCRGCSTWQVDLDVRPPNELVAKLSGLTGINLPGIFSTVLLDRCGVSSAVRPGMLQYIGSSQLTRKRRLPTLQFCPTCISGENAYFKKEWRFPFVVLCESHKTLLRDRCQCGAFPQPFRCLSPRTAFSLTCYRCRVALGRSFDEPLQLGATAAALFVQGLCLTVVKRGEITLGGQPLLLGDFFDGLSALITLMSSGSVAEALRATLETWQSPALCTARRRPARFETRVVYERCVSLCLISCWLVDWPKCFTNAIAAVRPTKRQLRSTIAIAPIWVRSVLTT